MIEAMKQWLEALEMVQADVKTTPNAYETQRQAVASLRQVIAELEKQEPVAWGIANTRPTERNPLMMVMLDEPAPSHLVVPLYTHPQPTERNYCARCGKRTNDIHTCTPPQPKREPLTDEIVGLLKEARKIIRASSSRNLVKDWDERTTKAIAAHGIKENT